MPVVREEYTIGMDPCLVPRTEEEYCKDCLGPDDEICKLEA